MYLPYIGAGLKSEMSMLSMLLADKETYVTRVAIR